MSKQVMIELEQVKKTNPYVRDEVLKANGEAAFDKPFPLSAILDTNGLNNTI